MADAIIIDKLTQLDRLGRYGAGPFAVFNFELPVWRRAILALASVQGQRSDDDVKAPMTSRRRTIPTRFAQSGAFMCFHTQK